MSITIILIGITLVASLLAFNNEDLMRKWILNPYLVHHKKQWWRMLLLYLGAIVIANGPSLQKNKDNHYYNSLGASGAVSAVIFAAILFQPWSKIYFFGVIGIPGILMGPLYLFIEYRMGKQGGTGINHDAHFWGAIFGLLFTLALKPKLLLYFFDQLMSGF
ncbi:MAG: rhomboid family intramembrane serine protease [Bacteroidetes bacterium]|nr:rhomboid family intramembrane serine protease [Bacteroidota bacterium]